MGAHEVARIPDRAAWQDLRHGFEHLASAGVAGDVRLAVDVAAVIAHRCMAHPPPSRRDDLGFVRIRHRDALSFSVLSLYVRHNAASRGYAV